VTPAVLLLALSLCAQPEPAVILRAPGGYGWLAVDTGDLEPRHVEVVPGATAIVWHLDPRVDLPATDIRPGVRIRLTATTTTAERIEVVTLGPLAMEAAVEEFVVEASGGRGGLGPEELAVVEVMGSRCYWTRETATKALAERGVAALRPLIWARRHRDAEVRARAEGLLRRLGWPG
jgi:hypothetical protein